VLPQFDAACELVPSSTEVDSPYRYDALMNRRLRYGRSTLNTRLQASPLSVLVRRITSLRPGTRLRV
jgi:hypothetical protein